MIVYKDIEQRTDEWFELKWGKIGGSTSKGLFVDSDNLFIELLSQHLEEYEPEEGFTTDAMQRGNDLEPFAREYISKYANIQFNEVGWIESKQCALMGVSPDGVSDDLTMACEIKCLGKKAHTQILLENAAPAIYIPQILQYFTVNPKLAKLWFIAFRPESIKHYVEVFTRESVIDMGLKIEVEVEVIGKRGVPIKPKIEKRPALMTIDKWGSVSMAKAIQLEYRIKQQVEQFKF